MNATHILTLLGVNSAEVLSFNVNGLPNGTAETVINLGNGGKLTYTSPANPPPVDPTEYHSVAYFAYPSSDGGMPLHRRVIVLEDVGGYTGYVRGYETTNDSDYKFKKFLKRRIPGYNYANERRFITFRDEAITDTDKANLTHL